MRLDQAMVTQGLAPTRSRAQALIRDGAVEVCSSRGEFGVMTRPAYRVESGEEVRLRPSALTRFVSRGGLKMQSALDHLGLGVKGYKVLDVGISTGGFSDCLLQNGAGRIVGVDVGHGQLHPDLSSRVSLFEGINARNLALESQLNPYHHFFDLIVVDVSFISLRLILNELPLFLAENGQILVLVKPQFELGAAFLNKKGIVKDPEAVRERLRSQVKSWCQDAGLIDLDYFACAIEGSDGNQEYFLYGQMDQMDASPGDARSVRRQETHQ